MNPTSEKDVIIDDQHLLINTVRNLTIKSNCGLSERNLSGSYLISYDNCTVNVSSIMVSNIIQLLTGKPIHLSLDDGLAITKGKQIFNLSLEHLNLLQTETRRELEQIRLENNSPWSIFGTFSFTPTIIGLAIFFSILAHSKAMKIQFTQPSREVPITTDMKVGFQHTTLDGASSLGPGKLTPRPPGLSTFHRWHHRRQRFGCSRQRRRHGARSAVSSIGIEASCRVLIWHY